MEDCERLTDLASHLLALALRARRAGKIAFANQLLGLAADAYERALLAERRETPHRTPIGRSNSAVAENRIEAAQ